MLISKKVNIGESRMPLLNTLFSLAQAQSYLALAQSPWQMCLKNLFGNGYDNISNTNKELLLPIKNCLVYNIV